MATDITPAAAAAIYQRFLDHLRIPQRFPRADWSIADLWIVQELFRCRTPVAQVQAILRLGSPGFPRRHSQPQDYLARTLRRAALDLEPAVSLRVRAHPVSRSVSIRSSINSSDRIARSPAKPAARAVSRSLSSKLDSPFAGLPRPRSSLGQRLAAAKAAAPGKGDLEILAFPASPLPLQPHLHPQPAAAHAGNNRALQDLVALPAELERIVSLVITPAPRHG